MQPLKQFRDRLCPSRFPQCTQAERLFRGTGAAIFLDHRRAPLLTRGDALPDSCRQRLLFNRPFPGFVTARIRPPQTCTVSDSARQPTSDSEEPRTRWQPTLHDGPSAEGREWPATGQAVRTGRCARARSRACGTTSRGRRGGRRSTGGRCGGSCGRRTPRGWRNASGPCSWRSGATGTGATGSTASTGASRA